MPPAPHATTLGVPAAPSRADDLPWWHVRVTRVTWWCWAASAFVAVGDGDWRAALALGGVGLAWSVPRVRHLMLVGLTCALGWSLARSLFAL